MKSSLPIFLFVLLAFCLNGQVNLTLHMDQKLDDQPFAHELAIQAEMGYYFKVTRLQYYVSEIRLIHDGGQVTPVTDLYLLVDPALDTEFELGSFNITDLEKIEFSIGVDPDHNHLDPASYPADHPLAPQNPSMHWGWASGYRFIAFEGFAGQDAQSLTNNFQIHTIGDNNYRSLILDVEEEWNGDAMEIHIEADYRHLLDDINASFGIVSHSTSGPAKQAIDNAREYVFSSTTTTGTKDLRSSASMQFAPNPSNGLPHLNYAAEGWQQLKLIITDMQGRMIYSKDLDAAGNTWNLEKEFQPGVYLANLYSDRELIAIEKMVVQ